VSKEEKMPTEQEAKETVLDLEDAKEMTVGQAARKNEEVEAGVTEGDNILDKYIKQHRDEIEAGKFETQKLRIMEELAQQKEALIQETIKQLKSQSQAKENTANTATPSAQPVKAETANSANVETTKATQPALTVAAEAPIIPATKPVSKPVPTVFEDEDEPETKPFYKKKAFLYSALGLVALAAGTTWYFHQSRGSHKSTTGSSSTVSSSKKKSTSSSEAKKEAAKEFEDLYASFFTDSSQTAIKNDKFGDLDKLKTKLDVLTGSSEYTAAKKKYDDLVKQISAIQSVNSQFNTGAIVDGLLKTDAQVKENANLPDVSTGNSKLDEVLKAAIAQGRSQQLPAPAPSPTVEPSAPSTTPTVPAAPSTPPAVTPAPSGIRNAETGIGLPSAGVNLQRHLSRVPYNQAAIDDVNNPAWTFNPDVLETILKVSRERGYITGDQFILEKVNIVKGNGYYNLYKPDGTYLFSMNCKTGYFVGNGAGYAEDLDY
jgi:holliday junction-specific endonuclease